MNFNYSDYLREANKIKTLDHSDTYIKLKVALLRSFTIEPLVPMVKVEAFRNKIYLDTYLSGYNQYAPEILDETSELYKFRPDVVILAVRLEELYPPVIDDYLSVLGEVEQVQQRIVNQMDLLMGVLKSKLSCKVLLHNFMIPVNNCCSLFDFQHLNGEVNFIRKINLMLVELANKYSEVYVIDIENIAGMLGKQTIFDKKMWYIAKNPFKPAFYQALSQEYVKYLKSIYGLKKKCLVLDLDNTLWGGVAGEEGLQGILLNDSYPGKCYKDFQRELLKLNKRGVLLAINSKNNFDEAIEIIRKHPDMVLKEDNFACVKINWDNKASNMVDIAYKLNIGLDSLVFIDDNAVECELIRQKLPEVTIVTLSNNPLEYVTVLRELNCFETTSFTQEDLKKSSLYHAQLQRDQLKDSVASLTEYFKSLEMVLDIQEVNEFLVPRVAELTQKTNQFNLTTRRYTREDILNMMRSPDYLLYSLRVTDKFGDNGTVGLCIIKKKQGANEWLIDTFLLSCRVMNRMIENAFMAYIYEKARQNGIEKLSGEFIPTPKNRPVANFYERLGFIKEADKYIFWINDGILNCPEYITFQM